MEWLSSANVIASLVFAIFGIGGYLFAIVTYLSRRAYPLKKTTSAASHQRQTPSKPISWLEWIELFTQGFVDTADFVLGLFSLKDDFEDRPPMSRIGFCSFICGFGVIFAELLIGFAIGIFLSFFGVNNPAGIAVGVTTVLLFMTFSLVYIYHVGLLVEKRQQQELYQELQRQSVSGHEQI